MTVQEAAFEMLEELQALKLEVCTAANRGQRDGFNAVFATARAVH